MSSEIHVKAAMSEANCEKGCDEGVRIIAVVTEKVRLVRKYERTLFLSLDTALLARRFAPHLVSPSAQLSSAEAEDFTADGSVTSITTGGGGGLLVCR